MGKSLPLTSHLFNAFLNHKNSESRSRSKLVFDSRGKPLSFYIANLGKDQGDNINRSFSLYVISLFNGMGVLEAEKSL